MTSGDRPARWLRLLAPLLLIAAIAWWVDVGMVAAALLSLPGGVVGVALGIATLDRLLMAFKWRQLVRAAGDRLGFPTALRIYYQASASGRVIPFPLGADMLRALLASRARVSRGNAVSSIVVERLIAMLAGALPALLGIVYLAVRMPERSGERAWFYALVGIGLMVAVVALALVLLSPVHRTARRVYERLAAKTLPGRVERLLGEVSQALLHYATRPRSLVVHTGLALLEQLVQYVKFAVLAFGLGIAAFSVSFFAVITVALFARRIGGVIEQWGMGEGSAVIALSLLGIEPELAVALLVANFAVSTLAVLPGAVLFYTHPPRLNRMPLDGAGESIASE